MNSKEKGADKMNKPVKIEAGKYSYRGYTLMKHRTASDYKTGMSSEYWGTEYGYDIFAMTLREACEDVDRNIRIKESTQA